MKKIILFIFVLCVYYCEKGYAQSNSSDLEFRDVYKDYIEQRNLSIFFDKLSIGDSLSISSSNFVAEYVIPDTIWIKNAKKPKLNKHYILQYKWKGVPTGEKTQKGLPVFKQSTYAIDDVFLYESYDKDEEGNFWIIVKEINSGKKIKILSSNLLVKSTKLKYKILERLATDTIFYANQSNRGEENYQFVEIKDVDYKVNMTNTKYTGQIKVITKGNSVASFKNGRLVINGGNIISSDKYHKYLRDILKDRNFLSLVVIEGRFEDTENSFFSSDTMALYKIEDKYEYLGTVHNIVYHCYAYGQSYTFTKHMIDVNFIRFISPKDTTYLRNRNAMGEKYRLERAKEWDMKNQWLIDRDKVWDQDSCVLAQVLWDFGHAGYKILSNGNIIEKGRGLTPPINAIVPVVKYVTHDENDFGSKFHFVYRGVLYSIMSHKLKFLNSEQYYYLMRRGKYGYESRLKNAHAYDFADEIANKSKYNKNQIFFIKCIVNSDKYGYDGLSLCFYNCFKKTIKYIDCTVVPYNSFNDIQPDANGKSSSSIRCIGPIEGTTNGFGEFGEFNFDDVFCNRNKLIKTYKVGKIVITFTDDTTISYSGWNKIKSHSIL